MGAAALIAKAVLKGIGGGMTGAADKYSAIAKKVGTDDTDNSQEFKDSAYSAANMGADEVSKAKDGILNQAMSKGASEGASKAGSSGADASSASAGASSAASSGAASSAGAGAAAAAGGSDKNLKDIYGENIDDRIIDAFAKISAIDFHYKPDAQKEYQGKYGVDSNEHIGVIAQELQQNPATEGTVMKNENGDLVVDTRHLAFADTAAIGELSRRVLALEQAVKELQNK